jgi:hypothetical protein
MAKNFGFQVAFPSQVLAYPNEHLLQPMTSSVTVDQMAQGE